jgi:hypothetical protein
MTLSAERMIALEDHYENWGLDEVRKELERPDRNAFVDLEATAITRARVEAKERSILRAKWRHQVVLAAGLVLLGLAIAMGLQFWEMIWWLY